MSSSYSTVSGFSQFVFFTAILPFCDVSTQIIYVLIRYALVFFGYLRRFASFYIAFVAVEGITIRE